MEGISVTAGMVRSALQSFCSGGGQVTTKQLMAVLGLECGAEKARLRRQLTDMVHHGEVKRVEAGVFEYNFSHRPRIPQSFSKIWRFETRVELQLRSVDDASFLHTGQPLLRMA